MNFMDGVILIEKITKMSTLANILIGVALIVCVIMVFGGCRLVTTTSRYCAQPDAVKGVGIALTLIGLALMATLSMTMSNNKQFKQLLSSVDWGLLEYTDEYRVTVTDDVDMNEFTSKYEIIDYDDGTYIIKAR